LQVYAFLQSPGLPRLKSPTRLYRDRLPLVLVLGAFKSKALYDLLPRTVRTHLSVSVFNVPNGQQMFDSILREVMYFHIYTPTRLNDQFRIGVVFLGYTTQSCFGNLGIRMAGSLVFGLWLERALYSLALTGESKKTPSSFISNMLHSCFSCGISISH
jgi:hypothetical protein